MQTPVDLLEEEAEVPLTPPKRQYEEVSVKLESEQIQWEPDEKLSQVMNFLEEVEK